MTNQSNKNEINEVLESTTKIISSFTLHSKIPTEDLVPLIKQTYCEIDALCKNQKTGAPAVPIDESIQKSHLVCLECGKEMKSLKRHLKTFHNLSPDEYRNKWSLPEDYPMVTSDYSKARSKLAKQMGLGQRDDSTPAPKAKSKTNGNKRTNGSSTRMVRAERGNNPAPS